MLCMINERRKGVMFRLNSHTIINPGKMLYNEKRDFYIHITETHGTPKSYCYSIGVDLFVFHA